jgi:hypothetical protein
LARQVHTPVVNGVRRVVFRSTGTKEIAAAKRIAGQIIESFWTDSGRGAEPLKLRNDNATIGELIAKSSISKRSFSFQKTCDLREENGISSK